MFDKNYFLTKLQNGENIDDIGAQLADAMNAAVADFEAENAAKARAEQEAAEFKAKKEEIANTLIATIVEYATLTNPAIADDIANFTDDDLHSLIDGLDQTFAMLVALKTITNTTQPTLSSTHSKKSAQASQKKMSDDEIIGNFIKMFS